MQANAAQEYVHVSEKIIKSVNSLLAIFNKIHLYYNSTRCFVKFWSNFNFLIHCQDAEHNAKNLWETQYMYNHALERTDIKL